MRHTLCILVVITLVGCTSETVAYTAVGPEGWAEEVRLAATEWRVELGVRGCEAPLVESKDGIALTWVPHLSEDDFGLVYTEDEVRVLDHKSDPYRGVLLHAFGRLMGVEKGGAGVMGENLCKLPNRLTEDDIERAMHALGCHGV